MLDIINQLDGYGLVVTDPEMIEERIKELGFPPSPIIIKLDGGLVQDIEGIPEGITVLVRDFDTEDMDDEDLSGPNEQGDKYFEQVYTQGAPA